LIVLGLSIPADSVSLVVGISERLASSEPQLTHDFLTEFFVGWDRSPPQQRPLNVLYVAPWLSNLRTHVLSQEVDSEKGKERLSLIARKLIDVALQETGLYTSFQQNIWSVISRDEALVEIFLDEMVKVAMVSGFASEKTEVIGSIAASLGTITVRGKVIARLRKALNRTSLRPTRHLPENTVWGEICVLLRICLAISFDSRVQAQLFLPELVHIITMVVNCGPPMTRALVHRLLVNTVHSMCTSFPLEEANLIKLKAILTSLSEPKIGLLFSLHPSASRDGMFVQEERGLDTATFSSMETIANLLLEIIVVGAPSTDMANLWRSRWMSLVASTAFQSNPAIQPRAFAVMGCLAREDVDDDLLYQVLVALRSGVTRFIEDSDSDMLIAIVTSLTKMMDKLPSTSRYVLQLFWLAMSLVRFSPPILFNCTVSFLESVLQVIAASGEFKEERMVPVLLQGRLPVEEAASEIDELYGVRFDSENFHFASSACLAKGLSDPVTKAAGLRALSTFLEIASASAPEERRFPNDVAVLPYLGLAAARATTVEESRDIFGIPPPNANYSPADIFAMINLDQIRDKELLLNTAITLIDFGSCEEAVQQRALGFLDRVAKKRPHVLLHL
jgi:neurofibromin 1